MNPKKLRISIITGLLVLIGEIYYLLIRADEQGMFAFAIITIPAILINTIRYSADFDKRMHPKSQYEGWFPHFERDAILPRGTGGTVFTSNSGPRDGFHIQKG